MCKAVMHCIIYMNKPQCKNPISPFFTTSGNFAGTSSSPPASHSFLKGVVVLKNMEIKRAVLYTGGL